MQNPDNQFHDLGSFFYTKLVDPYTSAVPSEHICSILQDQLEYCKECKRPICIAKIDIRDLLSLPPYKLNLYALHIIQGISHLLKIYLHPTDVMFFDGKEEYCIIMPGISRTEAREILEKMELQMEHTRIMEKPLSVKIGFSEYPSDSVDSESLSASADMALKIAKKSAKNRIIEYYIEKRIHRRHPFPKEVRYYAPGDRERIACIKNISAGGIMISGLEDLPCGKNIKLTFNLPTGDEITVYASAVWSRHDFTHSSIYLGLSFNNPCGDTIEKIAYSFPL